MSASPVSSPETLSALIATFSRWSVQGRTDDFETPIDDYGKRVLSMVIREVRRALSSERPTLSEQDADMPIGERAEALYRELLAKKLRWFEESAVADVERFGNEPDSHLIETLRELRHFLPSGCHWSVNVAIARIEKARSDLATARAAIDEALALIDNGYPTMPHTIARILRRAASPEPIRPAGQENV